MVRAHQQRPASRADLSLAACQAAGVYLLTVFAISFTVYPVVRQAIFSSPPGRYPFATPRGYTGSPALWLGCGIAGLVLLAGCDVARRVQRRRRHRPGQVPDVFYPLAAGVFCIGLTVLLAALGQDYGRPVPDSARVQHRAAAGLISPAHR